MQGAWPWPCCGTRMRTRGGCLPVSIKCFTASPERGAIRAYVPGGMAMAMSVLTTAFPRAGTEQS